jgi:hypothetical protein
VTHQFAIPQKRQKPVNEFETFALARTDQGRWLSDSAGALMEPIETRFSGWDDLAAILRATLAAGCLAPNINRITGPKVGALKIPTTNRFGMEVSNDALSFGARSSRTMPERNFSLRKASLSISV